MQSQKLKLIRENLGLNQKEFAEKLGIGQSYYSALELGKKEITTKLLKTLFENVGISSQWWYSSNRTISTEKMWANSVGVDVGNKLSLEFEMKIKRRLILEFSKDQSKDGRLYRIIHEVNNFQYIIDNLYHNYFKKIDVAEDTIAQFGNEKNFNYQAYKQNVLKALREFYEFMPVLEKLQSAVIQFYKEFEPLDKDGIIKGYLGEHQDDSLEKI